MDSPPCISNLLSRIADREATALEELHRQMAGRLFSIALSILKNKEESEDALQEIFLKIWKSSSRYNPSLGNPTSWLITIARNTSYDRYRKRVRQSQNYQTAEQDLTDMAHSYQPHQADDVLIGAERSDRIRGAMSQLVPDQREAIELAFFSGHTQQEVSERLGVPLGTIKARIRRGMQSLKPHLSPTA